ncbi:HTH_XRE domain containing protein [uncultured Caudovirales phage]|uniref:HTH_XRE domain containing protein n=1 Tax=uncultured Caudovirales phage TaxID=2100421 RepID=A0A6J7WCF5_9CAUD|nr:HTH_XRE domain containing protein [uncultured Caudovirales phage]
MTYPDNTQRIAQVNTRRIDTLGIVGRMNETKAERLRAARKKAGYNSAQEAAEAFGWGTAGYRHHENGTRGFGPDAAKKYGRAFRIKPGWLLAMDGISETEPQSFQSSVTLIVNGTVEAGVWREDSEGAESFEVDVPPPVQNAKRFGLVVEGFSMDLHYEPGSVLDCISIYANGIQPMTGDHVIVERIKPDGLRERTVKEFCARDGRFYLRPKSTRPEFQAEIEIGAPDGDHPHDGEQVNVVGFVVSAINPQALNLLDRLGKIRR